MAFFIPAGIALEDLGILALEYFFAEEVAPAVITAGAADVAGDLLLNTGAKKGAEKLAENLLTKEAENLATNLAEKEVINLSEEEIAVNTVGNGLKNTAGNTSLEADANLTGVTKNTTNKLNIINEESVAVDESANAGNILEDTTGGAAEKPQIIAEDDILGSPEILDATVMTPLEQLEAALEERGITMDGLGGYTWSQLGAAVGTGTLTVEEVLKYLDSEITQQVNETLENIGLKQDGIMSLSNFTLVLPDGRIANAEDLVQGGVTLIDNFKIGYDAGKTACDTAFENAKRNGQQRPDKLWIYSSIRNVEKNPKSAYVSKKLDQYLLNSDVLENPNKLLTTYDALYQIYDGNYIKPPYINEKGQVELIDEIGEKVTYLGEPNTFQFLGLEIDNPAVHGKWTGPSPPSNDLPVDSFDTVSFLNIAENTQATNKNLVDLKTASRLHHLLSENGKDFDGNTKSLMKFNLLWALKVKPIANALFNANNSDTSIKEFLSSDENDFYNFMLGKYTDKEKRRELSDVPNKLLWVQRKFKMDGRNQFYAGMMEGINVSYKYNLELFIKEDALNQLIESASV